ncbi:dihydrofolate reductase family protein [Methanoculleus methanifontis]|uniref:dihydrofolate reductase family protein n=1 Tax=Methanoculleus methanifontis TaxID=2584086 RepID=UPI00265890AF|nr:dihydrofolate reductase family protein [Methanoculleus sp. FWC-SCC3]
MEHTKDVVILVSEATPGDYLDYLREREYPFIRSGGSRVDLKGAIRELGERFGITRVVSDSGPDLNDVLIREGIADTISLIVHSIVVGEGEKKTLRPGRGADGARTPESRADGAGGGAPGLRPEEVRSRLPVRTTALCRRGGAKSGKAYTLIYCRGIRRTVLYGQRY